MPQACKCKMELEELFGDCFNCRVDFLALCPIEEDGISPQMVQLKHYKT